MHFDRLEPEKSSLPSQAETGTKADRKNPANGDETSMLRVSADLGLLEARRNQNEFEKSISVVEAGEIEFAEKASVKKTRQTDCWTNAKSWESESGLDV